MERSQVHESFVTVAARVAGALSSGNKETMWTPIILALVALAGPATAQEPYCYAKDRDPVLMFGTKTAYEFVHDKNKYRPIPNCKPMQFWMLARHGTRYPSKEDIEMMQKLPLLRDKIVHNHGGGKDGKLCHEDLENLKNWNFDVAMNQASRLTNQGRDDIKFLARRYKSRYPTLLNQSYVPELFEFRFTTSERTRDSAQSFAEGLFGSSSGVRFPTPLENDTLIKSYENCAAWTQDVDRNPLTTAEVDQFDRDPMMQKILHDVSQRLGFRYDLKIHDVLLMRDMCSFNKAWKINELSPWCAIFMHDELMVLEYRDDMLDYYKSAYGNELNAKLGCALVKDFIERFRRLEEGDVEHQPAGIFYFSHSKMIHMLLSALGIAHDHEPLTHSNYQSMQKRKWKVAQVGPFASNLVAVFYKCTDGEPYSVMFYLQEQWVPYDKCSVGLCSWNFIKTKFAETIQSCNINRICNKQDHNISNHIYSSNTLITILITVAFLLV